MVADGEERRGLEDRLGILGKEHLPTIVVVVEEGGIQRDNGAIRNCWGGHSPRWR